MSPVGSNQLFRRVRSLSHSAAGIGNHPACWNGLSPSVGLARRLVDERPQAIQPTIPHGSGGDITTGITSVHELLNAAEPRSSSRGFAPLLCWPPNLRPGPSTSCS